MPDPKTNKLTIYLLKNTITTVNDALKTTTPATTVVQIPDIGVWAFSNSKDNTPEWVRSFFRNHPSIDPSVFNNSSSKAVLLINLTYRKKKWFFAIPFGFGKFLLKDDIIVERFGLKITLNKIEATGLKSVGKRTISENPKNTVEQLSIESPAYDFTINIEKDIVSSISGRSNSPDFGKMLTGGDSLHVSTKADYTNINDFLKKCIDEYLSDAYKKHFEWIDFIQEIKDVQVNKDLDDALVEAINTHKGEVWLSVPNIVDWSNFAGFKYSNKKTDKLFDELSIPDLISIYGDFGKVNLSALKDNDITLWSSSTNSIMQKWSAYKCLNAQIGLKDKKGRDHSFILDNGKWYEIEKNFIKIVNDDIQKIPKSKLKLPNYTHSNEGEYNADAAVSVKGALLDKGNIRYGMGNSKIECCDILTRNRQLLFVKRYKSSFSMSHLFAQGFVSGQLLKMDNNFRDALQKILKPPFKLIIPGSKGVFNAADYELIYVIITKDIDLDLPFFSKINLRSYYNQLVSYGYKVSVCKVESI